LRDSPKDKVFATLWHLKKNAYAGSTIEAVGKRLHHISELCDLSNPEQAKGFIASSITSRSLLDIIFFTF